jgi:hypothetical protein
MSAHEIDCLHLPVILPPASIEAAAVDFAIDPMPPPGGIVF